MSIDTKYEFLAWKKGRVETDEPFTENEAIVFRAKDHALVPTLCFYVQECERLGSPQEHIDEVLKLIDRVKAWRKANPHLGKVPD